MLVEERALQFLLAEMGFNITNVDMVLEAPAPFGE